MGGKNSKIATRKLTGCNGPHCINLPMSQRFENVYTKAYYRSDGIFSRGNQSFYLCDGCYNTLSVSERRKFKIIKNNNTASNVNFLNT